MPSVMQKIVSIPAPTASRTASGAPAAGTKMHDVLAPVSRDRVGDRVEHRDRAVERRLAALARGHAGDDLRAVRQHRARVELALAAGDALDEQPRVAPDEDAHAAPPPRRAAPRPSPRRLVERRRGLEADRAPRGAAGLLGVRADDPDDHRHVARPAGRGPR